MKKNDFLLIIILLSVSLVGFFIVRSFTSDGGDYVVVREDNKIILKVELSKDGEYRVSSSNGYNVIKVVDGSVSVVEADCKNKVCVNHRPIEKSLESIICLPHKIIIEIDKAKDDSEVDSESK